MPERPLRVLFIVNHYPPDVNPSGKLMHLLAEGLRERGVKDSNITTIDDEVQAIDHALASCEAGDLLVIFGDKISRCWKQITKFKSEGQASATPAIEVVRAETTAPAPVVASKLDWGGTLVEDERGVRVVRETED